MDVLFTTSSYPTSKIIRWLLNEDCSHTALRYGDLIIHSDFMGVRVLHITDFQRKNTILHSVTGSKFAPPLEWILLKYGGKGYDFKAFFNMGLRILFRPLTKKIDVRQQTGMYLCTEFVTSVLNGKEDSYITPHQLYVKLVNSKEN